MARWMQDGYQRRVTVHLTPQGRAMIERLFPTQARLIRAHMAALSEREQEMLPKVCKELGDGNVRRYIAELTAEE